MGLHALRGLHTLNKKHPKPQTPPKRVGRRNRAGGLLKVTSFSQTCAASGLQTTPD